MILCLCQGVSDRTVRLAVINGAGSVDEVAQRCGAGSDCGSCQHAIEDIIDEAGVVAAGMPCSWRHNGGQGESTATESGRT
ncbi:MAG: (2Fe-2S)-binding protein [Bacteroidota bacterium]